MRSVFSAKAQDNELRVLDQLTMDAPKTKEMVGILSAINAPKALIVTMEKDDAVVRSATTSRK